MFYLYVEIQPLFTCDETLCLLSHFHGEGPYHIKINPLTTVMKELNSCFSPAKYIHNLMGTLKK